MKGKQNYRQNFGGRISAVSLFAGVGGFDLALRNAGVDVVASVEIDSKARGVLAHHFPNTQLFNDVTEVTGEQLRAAGFIPDDGIITGGFPCQDLSVGGKRAGLAGERSGLFWEIMRLADELQPRWLVLENVPGLLSSNGGRDFGTVLGALAERGYGWAYRILDAQYFGVAQRRRRVFIVGCLGDDGSAPGEVLALREGVRGYPAPSREAGEDVAADVGVSVAKTLGTKRRHDLDNGTYVPFVKVIRSGARDENGELPAEVWAERDIAPTLNVMDNSGDSWATVVIPTLLTMREGKDGGGKGPLLSEDKSLTLATGNGQTLITESAVRRLTPVECERLQGFPDDWTKHRIDEKNGLIEQGDSARYKQMGNAVAVPVVEWIVNRLVECAMSSAGNVGIA